MITTVETHGIATVDEVPTALADLIMVGVEEITIITIDRATQ